MPIDFPNSPTNGETFTVGDTTWVYNNGVWSILTSSASYSICTSSTRPASPGEGRMIFETDTNKVLVYNGSSWVETNDIDSTYGVQEALQSKINGLIAAVPSRSTITNQTTSTTSSTMVDTGLSVSITPTSTSSLVEITFTVYVGSSATTAYFINLVRGSTNIAQGASCTAGGVHIGSAMLDCISMTFIDSPATTSSTTYKLQWYRSSASTLYLNRRGDSTDVGPISYLQVREITQ